MLDMVVHAYNPRTLEVETGKSPVQGQAQLHNETLHQKNKTKQH
jgi:hypothetical protein